jgi:chromosome segregation ATPase
VPTAATESTDFSWQRLPPSGKIKKSYEHEDVPEQTMEIAVTGLLLVMSLLGAAAVVFFGARIFHGASRGDTEALRRESARLDEAIHSAVQLPSTQCSREQLTQLQAQTEEFLQAIETQKQVVTELEQRLESAQREIHTKESAQQALKWSKDDDERRLQEVTSAYESYSKQAGSLEQELAASLQNLDLISTQLTASEEQRAIFQELSLTLTQTSERLRELNLEYQSVHQRLEGLKAQHADLEEEYTKLIEQQLSL